MIEKYAGENSLSAVQDWMNNNYVRSSSIIQKTISSNGTYNPADDNVYGYDQIIVDVPNKEPVSFNEFAGKTLVSYEASNVQMLRSYAFYSNKNIINLSFPICSYISYRAFYNCISLAKVSLPVCSYIDSRAFEKCYSLKELSFPLCSYIGEYAFAACSSLSIIILLSQNICMLNNTNAFYGTPLLKSSFVGSIFVPSNLYNEYISANNWSYFSSKITSYITI